MQNNNNGTDWGDVGCLVLIGLFALPYILASIFQALLPFILIGTFGFLAYRVYVYDMETRNVTTWIEDFFNVPQSKRNQSQDTSQQIHYLDSQIKALQAENEQLKQLPPPDIKQEIHNSLRQYSNEIERQKKREVLDDIFGETSTDNYTRSEEFERQEFERNRKNTEDDLKSKSFELDMKGMLFEQDQKIFAQDKKIFEVRDEALQDRYQIRDEMRTGFEKVDTKFTYMDARFNKLEGEFASFKGYVTEKFAHLEISFSKEIESVRETVTKLKVDVKEEFANVKLQFGKEVLRLDRQQLMIVDKLNDYKNQVKAYSVEMMRVRNNAERFAIHGQDLLNKAQTLHQRHQLVLMKSSNELQMGLQQIAMHKESFANTVGSAKLKLDEISNDMHFTLKDMAYERIGINMLRQDYDQRVTLEKQKMQNLLLQQGHLEEKIRTAQSHGQQVEGLRHQLHMTKENLAYTSHRANLAYQENAMIRRLNR